MSRPQDQGILLPAPGVFRNGGMQILSDRPCDMGGAAIGTPVGLRAGSKLSVTARYRHRALFASDQVVLVFGNFTGDTAPLVGSGGIETPNRNAVRYKGYLQRNTASGLSDTSGARTPITFNGHRVGECAPDGLLFSDPIPFDLAANELFFIVTSTGVKGANYSIPICRIGSGGGTAYRSINNGDWTVAEDYTETASVGTQQVQGGIPGPLAVLGYSHLRQKTVAFFGDSIAAGTGDGGMYYQGSNGFLERVMTNLTALTIDNNWATNVIANFPFAKIARGGQTLAFFANPSVNYKQLRIGRLASTVVIEYSTNDFGGSTLAQIKANVLSVAARFIALGVKVIWTTSLPKTTSSDFFKTVAGQLTTAIEADRQGLNSWFRDMSASGYIAQAGGLAVADIWDAAAAVEVDVNGVPTLNGGYWPAAVSASDKTGTFTATSANTGTDSALGATQDQYKGYCIHVTSGAGTGQVSSLYGNDATGILVLSNGWVTTPAIGDAYELFRPYTIDGTHPATHGHQRIANALNTAPNLAKVI